MRRRGGVVALIGCALMLLPAAADARRNVYITSSTATDRIAVLDIGPDGSLTLQGMPVFVSNPAGVAMTPDGTRLYVAGDLGGTGTVGTYNVNADGSLSPTGGLPAQSGVGPYFSIAVTPDGSRVYVVQYGGNEFVRGFSINPGGSLTAIPGASMSVASPGTIAITPDGRHLYVTQTMLETVRGFTINPDGSLTPTPNTPYALEPGTNSAAQVAVSPSGGHLYVAGNGGPFTLSAFSIAENGSLALVPGGATPAGVDFPTGISIAPSGQRLYLAGGNPGDIAAFTLGGDGTRTPLGTVDTMGVTGLSVTPSGSRLYAALGLPQTKALGFDIAADGALAQFAQPFETAVDSQAFQSLVITPNQGPTAAFTASPLSAGFPSIMDGLSSADPDGTVANYAWDFGDGTTLSGATATPSHTYATPGTYTVTLTVTDNEGCSTAFVFTGQTASCNGGARATTSQPVTITDGTDPLLTLSGKKRQKLDPAIEVGASCDEACTVQGRGQLVVAKRPGGGERGALRGKRQTIKLKPRSLTLEAGTRGVLKIRVPLKARRSATRALDTGGRAIARLTVTATDGSGNATTKKRRVRLKAPRG